MLSIQETNVLGQIFDDTWGRSTTNASNRSPTHIVKCRLVGEGQVTVDYTCVVTFASESGLRDQKAVFENESVEATKDAVKRMKSKFKENAGRALKVKELSTNDSIEIINTSPHNPRKTAYYRRKSVLEVA